MWWTNLFWPSYQLNNDPIFHHKHLLMWVNVWELPSKTMEKIVRGRRISRIWWEKLINQYSINLLDDHYQQSVSRQNKLHSHATHKNVCTEVKLTHKLVYFSQSYSTPWFTHNGSRSLVRHALRVSRQAMRKPFFCSSQIFTVELISLTLMFIELWVVIFCKEPIPVDESNPRIVD